jgi:hypothetical protein
MTEQKALELFNRMQQWQAKRHSISGYLDSGGSMRTEAASIMSNWRELNTHQAISSVPGYTNAEVERIASVLRSNVCI